MTNAKIGTNSPKTPNLNKLKSERSVTLDHTRDDDKPIIKPLHIPFTNI